MPQLDGVFNLFPDLDTISANEIMGLSSQQYDHHFVENHLANRLLYPQTVAQTKAELDLDFVILSLAIQKHPEVFFNPTQNRVIIPQIASQHFPPLTRLIAVILLTISSEKVSDIWLKDANNQKLLGSFISQKMIHNLNITGEIKLSIENEEKTLIPNQLNLIPVPEKPVKLLLNQTESLSAVGGSLGLFVDLREDKV
jgi:hypothetical protein